MPSAKGKGAAKQGTAAAKGFEKEITSGSGESEIHKEEGSKKYWLMKAEPESRLEKGVDVAFSIDHFQRDGTTSWEGVRNFVARNHMRSMRLGDGVLFYHSNCKVPGVAGLAEVCKLTYPDHSAWDPKHPYYDAKTDKENPKWYMVDLRFSSRLPNLVPLGLLRDIAQLHPSDPSSSSKRREVGLSDQQIKAIKELPLLSAARLSVQPASKEAYEAIVQLSNGGAWQAWPGKWNPGVVGKGSKGGGAMGETEAEGTSGKEGVKSESEEEGRGGGKTKPKNQGSGTKKRKMKVEEAEEEVKPRAKAQRKDSKKGEVQPTSKGTRRSTRKR